ncbi:coiled-coil domain-containing protein 107 [Amazona aestiva]|uniref:Coiled-coil domain-containing protein 107 n=1 Tax=Amazona aestiva TaxID=12930 RepID=A0A0Q3LU20_AMAAE|nr:coiled-coil domain-containing protein 107 [Amazona aestiva]
MVLSAAQQVMVSVVLVLCVFVVMPRMFGAGGGGRAGRSLRGGKAGPGHYDLRQHRREHQLLELEQHLAQTEKMLNSLLTQLDPLSNCVNALACEQKDEIMTQLQSIRRLMKESGLDKSENTTKDLGNICNAKLEDLIQSFAEHSQEKEMDDREDDSNEDLLEYIDNDDRLEEHELHDDCEEHKFEQDVVEDQEIMNIASEEMGLRRRNRYE